MNKSAVFLVDSGPGIGLGHLRRSGILLDAMTHAGFECRLMCPDVGAAAALGRTAAPVPAAIEDVPSADVVICDSYSIRGEHLSHLRRRPSVLLVFDDMADRAINADLVLNHNLYGTTVDYAGLTDAAILRGPEFTLIDPDVLSARKRRSAHSGNGLVISFGGTDDGVRAVELLRGLGSVEGPCHIVVPPGVSPSESALGAAEENPGRVILQRGPDMPALLADARLYIGGAGMTALEAMVVGLDMVLFVLVDNQRLNAEAFGRLGHPVVQGFEPKRGAEIAAALLRQPFQQHASVVDGEGATRVVGAIEGLLRAKRPT